MYGPIIIDPAEPAPYAFDRDYVVMLSDWTPEPAEHVLAHLKKNSSWYNYLRRTVPQFFKALFRARSADARGTIVQDRLMWARMRMDATDISDCGMLHAVGGVRPPTDAALASTHVTTITDYGIAVKIPVFLFFCSAAPARQAGCFGDHRLRGVGSGLNYAPHRLCSACRRDMAEQRIRTAVAGPLQHVTKER